MDKIERLILDGHEGELLDYKAIQYSPDKTIDFIKDIIAMANSASEQDKYIIIGVKDKPEQKEFLGIVPEEFRDSAEYAVILSNYVEPEINFDYFKYELEGKVYGVFKIFNNDDRPYMVKKEKIERKAKGESQLRMGDAWVRKGSHNVRLQRSHLDTIYEGKEKLELGFVKHLLFARVERYGCASIEIRISNYTKKPATIIAGSLEVFNLQGKKLSRHNVYSIKEDKDEDFQIPLSPGQEIVGDLFVRFESSDAVRLGLNEDGFADCEFEFRLSFYDAKQQEYKVTTIGEIQAQGEVLWKVRQSPEKNKNWLGRRKY